MKKVIKVFGNLLFIIAVFILLIGLMTSLSSKSEKVYDVIKYRSYVIVTPSMKPTINPGDMIFVKKTDADKLEKGDIITFNKDNIVATHRIEEISDDSIITKGDNNNLEDTPINKSDVIGKFVFSIPKIGYIISFAISPIGLVTMGSIIVFIFIYDFIFREKKQK
ncbi:signal peptidase I [Clostridium bornimense]|nr:signal peptidase I [Clostridium bornimense]